MFLPLDIAPGLMIHKFLSPVRPNYLYPMKPFSVLSWEMTDRRKLTAFTPWNRFFNGFQNEVIYRSKSELPLKSLRKAYRGSEMVSNSSCATFMFSLISLKRSPQSILTLRSTTLIAMSTLGRFCSMNWIGLSRA